MKSNFLEIYGINKRFNGVVALSDFSCEVSVGEIVGIIGANGAGKTTLFNVLTGFVEAQDGKILFRDNSIVGWKPYAITRLGISRTFQELRLIRQNTVLENVLLSFKGQPGERLQHVFFRPRRCRDVEKANTEIAIQLLEKAGLRKKINDFADNLSYGQQKLLSLVCCLAAGGELLLLDEPVAGIAPEMVEKIISIISDVPKQGKSILLIEHNMEVIKRVCNRVIFMDAGKNVCEGKLEEIRNDPRVLEAYLD